jgi:hypothetical protein
LMGSSALTGAAIRTSPAAARPARVIRAFS